MGPRPDACSSADATSPALCRLDARVLVPADPVPAYRLRMGARVPPIGGLAAMWRPLITPLIDARADGGWVIDLLPAEHAAAVDPALLVRSRLLRVELVEGGPDGRRSVGHAGKSLKGRLARAILEAGATTPRAVAGLEGEGLSLGSRSSPGPDGRVTVTFVRTPVVAIVT